MSNPLVSVCCIVYNHREYIGSCLESIVSQKTDFNFEVLIHDDASTDGTSEVIRQYRDLYPNIVKPIIKYKNTYSSGSECFSNSIYEALFDRALGEYIAICEGDDFWINEKKLQYQVDLMNNNQNLDISFHPSFVIKDNNMDYLLGKHDDKLNIFSLDQVILGGGGFMPTSSLMIRKHVFNKELLEILRQSYVMDYIIQVISSRQGGALFIPYVMSVYRSMHKGSWSHTQNQNFFNFLNNHINLNKIYNLLSKTIPEMSETIETRAKATNLSVFSTLLKGK